MKSPESSNRNLPLTTALLTAVALVGCDERVQEQGTNIAEATRKTRESAQAITRKPADFEEPRYQKEVPQPEAPTTVNYDDPDCERVRIAKQALDALTSPSTIKSTRGTHSRIVTVGRKVEEDGTIVTSRQVASGAGTPKDLSSRSAAAERFFDASRAVGGLRIASERCLHRNGARGK